MHSELENTVLVKVVPFYSLFVDSVTTPAFSFSKYSWIKLTQAPNHTGL